MNRIERTTAGALIAGALLASFARAQAGNDPAGTLAPDSLDAPAATSVRDAARAREAAHAMAHGTYRHADAGRDDVAATSPVGAARRGSAPGTAPAADPHAGHVRTAPSPARDPHAGHAMPAPSPTPDPHAGHVLPAPSPSPDPHAGHVMPSPSPEPR